jgi:radical SAM-linked protein
MAEEKAALRGKNINVSFPSMRLDSFTEEIAAFAAGVRKSGFTFAPEAGSERLRQVINKNISEEDLYKSVEIALRNGWKVIKFYFMIGLPTETIEDVEAIADLLERVVKMGKTYGGRVRFNVSVSPFSPKPHTPFQWERQNTKEEFDEKVETLRRRFSRMRSVKFTWRDTDVSLLECVLGRGDRRLSEVIAKVWRAGGGFDGWTDYFDMNLWRRQMESENLDFEMFAGEIAADAPLPWQHINKGVTTSFLLKEREKAAKQETTKDCKKGYCFACGIQREGFKAYAKCYDVNLKKKNMAEEAFKISIDREKPPEKEAEAEAALRFRVHYKKSGLSRYLSHLDLIRIFARAARRAGIELMFSQGFNPHPKMSFGPSLSLGVTSDAEYLDMDIKPGFKGDLAAAFNPFLPAGLEMISAKPITGKIQTINQIINLAEYEVELGGKILKRDIVDEILSRNEIPIQRRVKKKDKIVDIRPYIETIRIEKDRLRIRTRTIDNRSVRMTEILRLLFKETVETHHFHIHRKAQWVRDGELLLTPMDMVR